MISSYFIYLLKKIIDKIKLILSFLWPTVEHALSKSSQITMAAARTDNITAMFHHYFTKTGTYNQMFAVMDYSFTTAALTLISNFVATFTWNFTDLFITLVSLALAERFHLFNQYLVSLRGKVIHRCILVFNNFYVKEVQCYICDFSWVHG